MSNLSKKYRHKEEWAGKLKVGNEKSTVEQSKSLGNRVREAPVIKCIKKKKIG